jgi:hypothetical protein
LLDNASHALFVTPGYSMYKFFLVSPNQYSATSDNEVQGGVAVGGSSASTGVCQTTTCPVQNLTPQLDKAIEDRLGPIQMEVQNQYGPIDARSLSKMSTWPSANSVPLQAALNNRADIHLHYQKILDMKKDADVAANKATGAPIPDYSLMSGPALLDMLIKYEDSFYPSQPTDYGFPNTTW